MAADYNTTRMILTGQRYGADLSSLATLGRMNVNVKRKDLARALVDFRCPVPAETLDQIYSAGPYPYAEPLLHALGARSIESIDASAYEGATIVHDMNEAIPTALHERFTTIIDHGTMEHIFNFPVVVQNCMNVLKMGGHFLSATCANNFVGHGFYQFSPELFFRVFSAANGFLIKGVFLVEEDSKGAWYRVLDPALTGERATLINDRPTYIMVIAQKLGRVATFTTPQQSDYLAVWNRPHVDGGAPPNAVAALVRRYLPPKMAKVLSNLKYRIQYRYLWSDGFRSKHYFRRFQPASDPIAIP